ncbi:MAG: UvrD-helicase domain-containing protein [Planctomycetaceae bacterium]|nr:UvrD-helicase domain-containing protein [Planctomycetaceae bacterium]
MNSATHVLISASAGTGKTFQLSNRYLGLLQRGVMPDQILATTFTRKAAGEILDRVMVRLAEAALDADKRRELGRWLPAAELSATRCQEMLWQMLRQLHRLRVSTLDAFFAQLAGSFSLELGLPPGWQIVDELQEQYLRSEAIQRTLQGDSTREVQRLVQLMAKGTAQRSVSELVRDTVDKLYDLYMATDAEAWHQIPQPRPLRDKTLAALIQELRDAPLPENNRAKDGRAEDSRAEDARDKDLSAAETGDWELFISRGLAAKILAGDTTFYRKPIPSENVQVYQRLLNQARAILLDQMARQMEATYALLDKFHSIYAQLKRQTGALRFEDITRALAAHDRLGSIDRQCFRLDTPITHLLLDEFQDTSLAQWQVLRPLAQDVTAAATDAGDGPRSPGAVPPSFFCVGDAKQAIYAWRGGRSEIFEALPRELPHLTQQLLTESYRSSQPVIDIVNRLFNQMTRHGNLERFADPVAAWCKRFPHHTTACHEFPGYVELRTAPDAADGDRADNVKLTYAADRIKQLVAAAPGCSIGVLTRRNATVKQLIYELRRRNVPASEEGGNPLTDSPAVQVVLSLLRLADHPGDSIARFHVAQSPLATHLNYHDHTDDTHTWALASSVRGQLLHAGYGRAIQRWAGALEPSCDLRDASRLQQLVEVAFGYEPLATLRTVDFLQYVELERVADPTAADVRAMTVHQAKGLQFDIVVLPDLDAPLSGQPDPFVVGQPSPTEPINCVCLHRRESIQQLLPDSLQKLFAEATRQSVEEALCVLYVAVTRAVYSLYLIVNPSSRSEKKLPKSAAGLVRAALTDGQPLAGDTVACCHGDPCWYEKITRRPAAGRDAPQVQAVPRVKLAPMPSDSRLAVTSPSELEGGARVQAARVLNLASSVAAARGTLIHALFEQVDWLDDGAPDPLQLQHAARSTPAPGLDVDQQLAAFQDMLQMPAVSAVLQRAFYESPDDPDLRQALTAAGAGTPLKPVACNERRFAVRDEGRLLSGIIDRLVLLYHGDQLVAADIVDYKTDSVARDDPTQLDRLVEFYRPQLAAYRRAVAAIYRLPPRQICARLLFVSAGIGRSIA